MCIFAKRRKPTTLNAHTMNALKYILAYSLCILMTVGTHAGPKPYIANFTRDKYHAANKNWSIGQDERGVMYFGNDLGLLESDGISWKLYPMPNIPIVRSLAVESHHTIYTGGDGELGRWDRLQSGELKYTSLNHLITDSKVQDEAFWRVWLDKDKVYFQSFSNLYIYNHKSMQKISLPQGLMFLQRVRNEYWVQEMYGSLYRIKAGSLQKIEGSDFLNGQLARVILPYGKNEYLIGTDKGKLYIFNGKEHRLWNEELSKKLNGTELNCGIYCDKRKAYYLGTQLSGLYEVNTEGHIHNHFHADNELPNNTALSLYEDSNNNIWVAMDRGLSYLRYTDGLSYYLTFSNNTRAVYAAALWKGELIIGTNQGVFHAKTQGINEQETLSSLQFIEGTQGQVWDFYETDGRLFCCHNNGLLEITPDFTFKPQYNLNTGVFQIVDDIINGIPLRIIVGYNKLYIANRRTGKIHTMTQIGDLIRHAAIDHLGNIWLETLNRGVYKCRLNEEMNAFRYYIYYGNENDKQLPTRLKLFKISGRILFLGDNRFYTYSEDQDNLQSNALLNNCFKGVDNLKRLIPINNEEGWAITSSSVYRFLYDGYIAHIKEAYQVGTEHATFNTDAENISILNDSLSLICLDAGFILHNSWQSEQRHTQLAPPNLEYVHAGHEYASLQQPLEFPFKDNTVSVGISVNGAFADNLIPEYLLEGVDSTWNQSTQPNNISYARLPQGDYTLHLRTGDGLGNYSEENLIKFKIQSPWYRTIWWYTVCCMLAAGISYLIFWSTKKRMHAKHLQRLKLQEAEYLQKINEQLQSEIEEKNAELFTQTSFIIHKNELMLKLKEMVDEICSKNTQKSLVPLYLKLNNLLTSNLNTEDDWKMFLIKFEQKHHNFFKTLKECYPQLTTNDLRLCACLKLNMDTKDIASLMNLSIRAVENNRYRLRKKLDLKPAQNLNDFFLSIE